MEQKTKTSKVQMFKLQFRSNLLDKQGRKCRKCGFLDETAKPKKE